jgi:hypothetical protein
VRRIANIVATILEVYESTVLVGSRYKWNKSYRRMTLDLSRYSLHLFPDCGECGLAREHEPVLRRTDIGPRSNRFIRRWLCHEVRLPTAEGSSPRKSSRCLIMFWENCACLLQQFLYNDMSPNIPHLSFINSLFSQHSLCHRILLSIMSNE